MPASPDDERENEAAGAPERGPRILFFSGGSALRPLCHTLKRATHNSVHIVTTFDSGGSSGPLRAAFRAPALGDLRNRLVALADDDLAGSAESVGLVSHRLTRDGAPASLRERLDELITGRDDLMAGAPPTLRKFAQRQLLAFQERVPLGFDLRGHSVGNLILAGAWLENRNLSAAITALAALLAVRGTIHPTVDADLHLAVVLADGRRIVGQHRFTGKDRPRLTSPITKLELVDSLDAAEPARVDAPADVLAAIRAADLIVFPMGSLFSSLLCNLLPRGIGRAIALARCPKVYVPNAGDDPEMHGIDVTRATELLLETLREDAGADVPARDLLNIVLLDKSAEAYAHAPDPRAIARLGVECQAVLTTSDANANQIDIERLVGTLMSLARSRA